LHAAEAARAPAATRIARMAAGGDGVAEDGSFVAFALPGEVVEARPAGKDRAVLEAVREPSAERVPPPCIHFGACGGCALQHWDLAAYGAWKRARLAEALSRAGYAHVALEPGFTTPRNSRRRADLGLERLADGRVAIGFHERGSTRLIPMRECHVLRPELVRLLGPLAEALRNISALRRLGAVLVNMLDTGPDILLRTDAPLTLHDRQRLAAFAKGHDIPRIAWAGKGTGVEVAAQQAPVSILLDGVAVAPPPGAFLQASAEGEAAIVAAVMAGLPAKMGARPRLADLYAGIGTLSFPLAARGVVEAFEGDAPAAAALTAAAHAAQSRVLPKRRDLVRQPLLPAELKAFAAVVLDPPFNGAAEQVAQISRSALKRLVYVSCNPSALGRDAAVLREAGFALEGATPVDQFLWSPHLESVVAFAR
jgi:23S rRNA (uracil1939-C5)-methyltransferase